MTPPVSRDTHPQSAGDGGLPGADELAADALAESAAASRGGARRAWRPAVEPAGQLAPHLAGERGWLVPDAALERPGSRSAGPTDAGRVVLRLRLRLQARQAAACRLAAPATPPSSPLLADRRDVRAAAAVGDHEPEPGEHQAADHHRSATAWAEGMPEPAAPAARPRVPGRDFPGRAAGGPLSPAGSAVGRGRPAARGRRGENSSGLAERSVPFASPAPAAAQSARQPAIGGVGRCRVVARAAASAAMAALIRASNEAGSAGLRNRRQERGHLGRLRVRVPGVGAAVRSRRRGARRPGLPIPVATARSYASSLLR